jgi:O-antigen/teichoic acid export membrane protein
MFSTSVVLTALASVDQFAIGSVMGVASVAHYGVPMSLVQRSSAIPMALGRTLFPRMSSLSGDAAHALGTRALAIMAYGFAAICAPAIILSSTFFRYWISADFAVVSPRLSVFGGLAQSYSGPGEPSAHCPWRSDQPSQADFARQYKRAKMKRPDCFGGPTAVCATAGA